MSLLWIRLRFTGLRICFTVICVSSSALLLEGTTIPQNFGIITSGNKRRILSQYLLLSNSFHSIFSYFQRLLFRFLISVLTTGVFLAITFSGLADSFNCTLFAFSTVFIFTAACLVFSIGCLSFCFCRSVLVVLFVVLFFIFLFCYRFFHFDNFSWFFTSAFYICFLFSSFSYSFRLCCFFVSIFFTAVFTRLI